VLPFALVMAGRDAAASDRWSLGEALYGEAIQLARETGQATPLCAGLSWLAGLEARAGHEEACRRHAAEALALCDRHGLGFFRLWTLDALADLELGLGRPDAAMATLAEKQERPREAGIADPDVSAVPQLVEASVRAGRTEQVLTPLDEFAHQAKRKGQPWALAKLERCRGLMADEPQLEHHFREALRLHELTPDRFEEALTRLCYGERLRRTKRRLQARSELRRAFQAFDELDAAPWAERAALELRATGETARRRDPSTLDQLTPQELQIALVLAEGATTREAATRLFLSPKTIEYHLRNVYRKLGVRSRDALARAVAVRAGPSSSTDAAGLGRSPQVDGGAAPATAPRRVGTPD
jgi:DNA-binding CsgD family transcriptional regulator